jgi:hypothetical protein
MTTVTSDQRFIEEGGQGRDGVLKGGPALKVSCAMEAELGVLGGGAVQQALFMGTERQRMSRGAPGTRDVISSQPPGEIRSSPPFARGLLRDSVEEMTAWAHCSATKRVRPETDTGGPPVGAQGQPVTWVDGPTCKGENG